MSTSRFSFKDFALRLIFALILACSTFNTSGYSMVHWILKSVPNNITPVLAVCVILLIIGWAIYIRATLRSLGTAGVALLLALLAAFIWLLWDLGWLSVNNFSAVSWVANIGAALLLAVGISWSHIRRKISGQQDVDDV